MTTATASTVFGVCLFLVILAAGARLLYVYWQRFVLQWKPLPGFNGAWYVGHENGPVARVDVLTAAYAWALERLARIWPDARRACDGVRVKVMPTPEWHDVWQRKIAGDEAGEYVTVGSDFAALLHELAHLVELRLDGVVDAAHAGWAAKGIRAAEDDFAAWLKAQR
jgi:hypothetical protein